MGKYPPTIPVLLISTLGPGGVGVSKCAGFFHKSLGKDYSMTAKQWASRIKKVMKGNDTYRNTFDTTIKILSEILAERDTVMEKYNGDPVVMHTNSHGATNPVKNQHLVMWNELNKTALAYIKELGLTPAGLKKISSAEIKKTSNTFDSFLNALDSSIGED